MPGPRSFDPSLRCHCEDGALVLVVSAHSDVSLFTIAIVTLHF